jgi:hypothetical protein
MLMFRRAVVRLSIEALEARLPLGDALLGGMAAGWLGSSLATSATAIPAHDSTWAPDQPYSRR